MAAHKFTHPVAQRIGLCAHGQPCQMTPDVFQKRLCRSIAAIRFFAQGLQHYRVEVASQSSLQAFARCVAGLADGLRRDLLGRSICFAAFGRPPDGCARSLRLFLTDDTLQLRTAPPREPIRPVARQEFIQQHPEAVDIRGRRDGLTAYLLGAGVFGRHHQVARLRQRRFLVRLFAQQLGDAEIEQFDLAAVGHEDVVGFEIAVDDEVGVGVLHRLAHVLKQPQAVLNAEASFVAVVGDDLAVDILHDEVGLSGVGHAAVEQVGDVLVAQAGEDASFGQKTTMDLARGEAAANDFEGDLCVEGSVGALGQKDLSHAALCQFFDDLVGADVPAYQGRVFEGRGELGGLVGREGMEQGSKVPAVEGR